ncbi:MAG: SIR2 family NAD-dependent protein deacylase [Cyclonatronaceae bacterium]
MTDFQTRIAVLSGAGISAESGLKTFRDSGGLWEGHDMMEMASIEAWQWNKKAMLEFYNERRKQALQARPNAAHYALAELQQVCHLDVITQNVDDLHERGGAQNVLHLHGKLSEVRSSADESLVYDVGANSITLGDTCEKGSQLRPNVVWFGEAVPNFPIAQQIMRQADYVIIVGTSLMVYPAASLLDDVPQYSPVYLVDPSADEIRPPHAQIKLIAEPASRALPRLVEQLKARIQAHKKN